MTRVFITGTIFSIMLGVYAENSFAANATATDLTEPVKQLIATPPEASGQPATPAAEQAPAVAAETPAAATTAPATPSAESAAAPAAVPAEPVKAPEAVATPAAAPAPVPAAPAETNAATAPAPEAPKTESAVTQPPASEVKAEEKKEAVKSEEPAKAPAKKTAAKKTKKKVAAKKAPKPAPQFVKKEPTPSLDSAGNYTTNPDGTITIHRDAVASQDRNQQATGHAPPAAYYDSNGRRVIQDRQAGMPPEANQQQGPMDRSQNWFNRWIGGMKVGNLKVENAKTPRPLND